MELLRMATGTEPRVCTVVRRLSSMLFKYQGPSHGSDRE